MQRWEYIILDCKRDSNGKWRPWMIIGNEIKAWYELNIPSVLSELGDDGWEIVSLSHLIDREFWVFKRSKSQDRP